VPRNVGQIPVYYNKKNPRGHDYVEMSAAPLYPFGYGLSYSRFEYGNLIIKQKGKHEFEVQCSIKNTSGVDGAEVVQLYLRDELASVVQPLLQLKKFERVQLKAGEEKRVIFTVSEADLAIINHALKTEVEPGDFSVLIGSSSKDIRLKGKITVD
jgi:beta-glucosidase